MPRRARDGGGRSKSHGHGEARCPEPRGAIWTERGGRLCRYSRLLQTASSDRQTHRERHAHTTTINRNRVFPVCFTCCLPNHQYRNLSSPLLPLPQHEFINVKPRRRGWKCPSLCKDKTPSLANGGLAVAIGHRDWARRGKISLLSSAKQEPYRPQVCRRNQLSPGPRGL